MYSGSAKLIYCQIMGSNWTHFNIFTRTENLVNAETMAAGEFRGILKMVY